MKFNMKSTQVRIVVIVIAILIGTGGILMAPACSAVGATPRGNAVNVLKESKNYKEGVFVNGIAAQDIAFFKTLKEYIKGGEHTTPQQPVPVIKRSKSDFASLPANGLRTTWIGHSTTLVEIDGMRLLLDPIWSKRSSPISWAGPKRFHQAPIEMEELPPLDAVLISHDHYDHLDKETVVTLAQTGVRFIVPLGVGARMVSWGIDSTQIEELDWWENTMVGDIKITATPSRHFSGRSLVMADRNKTLWAGFAMNGPIHKVYYSGDTGMFPGFIEIGERLGPFDIALVEAGAYHEQWADLHLGPEQAIQAAQMVKAKLFVPVHWATFNLALHSWIEPGERIIVAAIKHKIATVIPKPGGSVEPGSVSRLERWWPKLSWQSEQEHPVVSSGLLTKNSFE